MYSFEIVKVTNTERWYDLLNKCKSYDFYFTSYYQLLQDEGEPVMLVGNDHKDFILFPLIKREIPDTLYFDVTSVYGYCGPLSTIPFENLKNNFISFYHEQVRKYFVSNNIISAFSRLHPLIKQNNFFANFGEVVELNKTVSVDLSLPIEEQRSNYRKSLKSELNQLRRLGYYVEETKLDADIDEFISIYELTMDKLNASGRYYFDRSYFHSFLKNTAFESKLLVAKYEDQIIAGAIFTLVGDIMQYHLAGTLPEFAKKAPMKLILDEARLLGNERNLKHLHLGGGVGGDDTDSLFRFKSGFSKDFYQFSIWKYIVDQKIYDQIVEKKSLSNENSDFFPLYRLSQ